MSIMCDISQENCYNVIIIGGGPAAISAAIYCHRYNLKTVMIGEELGGNVAKTYLIENYPGYHNISGFDLMAKFQEHFEYFHIPYIYDTVMEINRTKSNTFQVHTAGGNIYTGCALLFATGTKYRQLNVPGEHELHGKGVSYCATCDGFFFRDKTIIVVGGSDSAAVEALFLSTLAKKVYIVYRRDKIRAEPINAKRCESNDKIEIISNTVITKIIGASRVEAVEFQDGRIFPTDAVFVEIGAIPQSSLAKKAGVILNEANEIIVDKYAQTNVPGIFAAGDVTNIREKQVITACGQAVAASYSIRDYLERNICTDEF